MPDPSRGFAIEALAHLPPSPPTAAPADLPSPAGGRIVNLSLNEGPDGPFPAALEALALVAGSLNRYPSRGALALTGALADRLGVSGDQVFVAAGADSVIGYLTQAALEPGDEVVVPWPSFPSFVRDTHKRDARPVTVPLENGRIALEAVLERVGPRTRLVFVATPNNPTGLALAPGELAAFVDAVPDHVVTVVDEAYFEYQQPGGVADAVAELVRPGRRVVAIRTFSKLFGLAGLRIGYAAGPADVVDALRRVQRGYDVGAAGQAAALASLDDVGEIDRRRSANRAAVQRLESIIEGHGLACLTGSASNFVFVDAGARAEELAVALLARGVVVQPAEPFGAPGGVRITAGSDDDLDALDQALGDALTELGDG